MLGAACFIYVQTTDGVHVGRAKARMTQRTVSAPRYSYVAASQNRPLAPVGRVYKAAIWVQASVVCRPLHR